MSTLALAMAVRNPEQVVTPAVARRTQGPQAQIQP